MKKMRLPVMSLPSSQSASPFNQAACENLAAGVAELRIDQLVKSVEQPASSAKSLALGRGDNLVDGE